MMMLNLWRQNFPSQWIKAGPTNCDWFILILQGVETLTGAILLCKEDVIKEWEKKFNGMW